MPLIKVKNLVKTFIDGNKETRVLKGIDFTAERGEWVSIMGRSGAGKSTMMYQMSLLDEATSGEIHLFDKNVQDMTAEERTVFRLTQLGYVFQDYALLPDLTAIENVSVPLMMLGNSKLNAYKEAELALEEVGLAHRLHNLPSQLSGGEQQRTSVARAIAHKPKILFADEPTANLDRVSSGTVMELFKRIHAAGQTIIMVTHEEEYSRLSERIIYIDDGLVVREEKISH
jgi:putative ABC transport system ATP-binding protein